MIKFKRAQTYCHRLFKFLDLEVISPIASNKSNDESVLPISPASTNCKDALFNASVAELRRKAQEHSEALLKNIQSQQEKTNEPLTGRNATSNGKSVDDANPKEPNVGIVNGKILPTSGLGLDKIPGIPSIDLPRFPPPNYLSALSNFGFHGMPTLPDINSQSLGLTQRFASNLANIMDKSSVESNLKNITEIIGLNDSNVKDVVTDSEGKSELSSSDNKQRCPSSSSIV